MVRRIAILGVVACILVIGLSYFFRMAYPFVLASEKARTSLEVTEEQTKELNSAELSSDMIAYAIFSGIVGGVMGGFFGIPSSTGKRMTGLLTGIGLGALAGVGMAVVGHWFDKSAMVNINDPMMHSMARWCAMLLLLALAVGIAVGLSGTGSAPLVNAIIGAILGAFAAAVIYSVLSGTATTLEAKNKILPAHDANRFLIMLASFVCIGIGTISQLHRKPIGSSIESVPLSK